MKYPDSVSSLARLPGFPVAYWGRSALQLPLQSVDHTRFLHSDVSIQFYGRSIHVSQEYHTVFGCGDDGAPTVAELAALAGTIPYELLCGVSLRVPRIYTEN